MWSILFRLSKQNSSSISLLFHKFHIFLHHISWFYHHNIWHRERLMTCLTVQFYTAPSPFLVSSSSAQEDQISSSASCSHKPSVCVPHIGTSLTFNPLNPELNPICYLLALLAHHFLHVSRIMVKLLTLRLLMSHIYGVHIFDVSRSHTTTHHSQ